MIEGVSEDPPFVLMASEWVKILFKVAFTLLFPTRKITVVPWLGCIESTSEHSEI